MSGNYFTVLGVRPALGRLLTEADDRRGDPQPVAVLSHAFWRRQFGADPGVLGRRLYLYGSPFTVIGVTPPEFTGEMPGRVRDFWVPLEMQPVAHPDPTLQGARGFPWLSVMGRLEPGARLHQINGMAPSLAGRPSGCAFRPRCTHAVTRCTEQAPSVTTEGPRSYRCYVPIAREAQ